MSILLSCYVFNGTGIVNRGAYEIILAECGCADILTQFQLNFGDNLIFFVEFLLFLFVRYVRAYRIRLKRRKQTLRFHWHKF